MTLSSFIRWPASISDYIMWLLWMLPAAYMLADFTEDVIIIALLNRPESVEGAAFSALAVFRSIKIAAVTTGFVQVLALWRASHIWVHTPRR